VQECALLSPKSSIVLFEDQLHHPSRDVLNETDLIGRQRLTTDIVRRKVKKYRIDLGSSKSVNQRTARC
jgi:hypothetical protein